MAKAIDLTGTEFDYSKAENRKKYPQLFGFPDGITEKNKNGGDRTCFTPEVADKLRQAFEIAASDLEACRFAGISAEALYNHQRKYPEFVKYKEWLKETPDLAARNVVARAAQTSLGAAQWWLERRKKAEFSTRNEVTGANGESLSPEQPKILETLLKVTDALQRNAKGEKKSTKPVAKPKPRPKAKPVIKAKEVNEPKRQDTTPSKTTKASTTPPISLRKRLQAEGNRG